MASNFEEYVKLYNEADKAARQLHIAPTDLSIKLNLMMTGVIFSDEIDTDILFDYGCCTCGTAT
jgi:hypothetical protein